MTAKVAYAARKRYRLDDIAVRGSGHTPSQKHPEYWDGDVPWLSLADSALLDKGWITSNNRNITQAGIANSSAVIHPRNTVVLLRDAGVGKSGILGKGMAVSQHFMAWQADEKVLHHRYLYQWLQWMAPEFERMAVGSTVKTIGLPYFKKLVIDLPSLESQVKVADALQLADAAIGQAESFSTHLNSRRQSLMQQLLTGRQRIKGFKEKWQLLRADRLFAETSLRNQSTDESLLSVTQDRGVIPRSMLTGRVTMPTGSIETFKLVEPDNFVISLRSFQGGLEHSAFRGLVSPAYTVLKANEVVHPPYFRHYFKSPDFVRRLSVAVIGVRDGKQISYTDFRSIKLPLPPIAEQRALTEVIDLAEEDLALCSARLGALQQQKRALLQRLLSGEAT